MEGELKSVLSVVFVAIIAVVVAGLLLAAACLGGLWFMLLWGSLYHELGWPSNTIAYWPAVGISVLLEIVIRGIKGKSYGQQIQEELVKYKKAKVRR